MKDFSDEMSNQKKLISILFFKKQVNRGLLKQMVGFYNQKYDDGSEMMVARSLTFFDDANTDEDPRILNQKFDWQDVQRTILHEVKKIF